MYSDTDVGSDFEVISDDNHSDESFSESPLLKAIKKPMDYSTTSSGSPSSGTEDTIVNNTVFTSMDLAVSSMVDDIMQSSMDDIALEIKQRREIPKAFDDSHHSENGNVFDVPDAEEDNSDSEIEKMREETKTILKNAIGQLEAFAEDNSSMQERISQLEKTVERLTAKNKNLQKINENGTIFERRRRQREEQRTGETVDDEQGEIAEEEVSIEYRNKDNCCSWKTVLIFSLLFAGFMCIAAVAMHSLENEDRIERLHHVVAIERQVNEKLKAELALFEKRLNESFAHIQKLNRLLYSPLQSDFFAVLDTEDQMMANNCFLGENSTETVCQKMNDLLETQGYENIRLKEKLRIMRYVANFFVGLLLFMASWIIYGRRSR